jgi:hypothetical protein
MTYKYISIAIKCQPYTLDTLQKRFPNRVYFIAKKQNCIKINFIFGSKVSYMEQYLVPNLSKTCELLRLLASRPDGVSAAECAASLD